MKNILKSAIFAIISTILFSCSKDNDTPNVVSPIYEAFGYFKGTINYTNETPIPVIFVFEDNNKLVVAQTSTTLNESSNLQKGSYTISGNQISGSYTNQNILPPTTFNFSGTYDANKAKFTGTIGTGTITLQKRI